MFEYFDVALRWLTTAYGVLGAHSHAAAIVTLTVIVKLALLPLTIRRIRASLAMARLKPELDRLQRKHKGDAKRLMLERNAVMRREGVTAASMVAPLLLQTPVLYGMYHAIRRLKGRLPLLGLGNLAASAASGPVGLVLLALMVVAQVAASRQMNAISGQAQAKLVTLSPALFALMLIGMPAALALYWATQATLDLSVQTIVLRRARR